MKYTDIEWNDLSVKIKLSSFILDDGSSEYHAIIEYTGRFETAKVQYQNVNKAISKLQKQLENTVLVLTRYFVSDAVNQSDLIQKNAVKSAISIVQQPPLNGTKVAAWVYFVSCANIEFEDDGTIILNRPSYQHLFNTQLQKPMKDEYAETEYIFDTYTQSLANRECSLADNCIRTWIYVQGVDIHYSDMVKARGEYFKQEKLTKDTHYIASTGIEGRHLNPQTLVLMDAYAIKGIRQEQIKYLYAPTHLNPTYEYGVTFERATSVDYGDRRHIFVSGTASIDNKGDIVYVGDIEKQVERTLENIEVLLSEGDAKMNDIAQMIVYLRDIADYDRINSYLSLHYPATPKVLVLAPVCRPGWLIEIECIAIKGINNTDFPSY